MPSPRRLFLPLATLALVGAATFVYSRCFAPSPPSPLPVDSRSSDARDATSDVEALDRVFPRLSQLFPDKNDWRRRSPNVVAPANRSVVFIFKNESIVSQDRTQVALNACTIVFLATGDRLSDEERCRQALVFESTDRVVLEFTQPLADVGSFDSANFDFSSFLSGEMKGEVVLRSDMKSPGAEDDVRFQTRDLVFTEKQIRTNFEFSFQIGRNNGSGRGLTIDLDLPLDFAARDAATNAPAVAENDPDATFRARVDALRREGNLGCGFSIEQIELTELDGYSRFYLDDSLADSFSTSNADATAPENASPRRDGDSYIDVRCKKGVYFSSNPDAFGGWCVRFNDSVEVVSYRDGAKAEQLLCGALYLYLQDPEFERLAAERPDYRQLLGRNVPTGSLARLVPTIIRAQRSVDAPTLVRVDGENVEVSADEIQYDVRRRVLNLFSNEETNESARLRAQTDARVDFSANAVQIQLDETNKPQTILARGSGKLDAYLRDDDGSERRIQADWQNGLRVAPEPNQPEQYKLSTQGAVAFYLDGVGTFSAREADFWARTADATRVDGQTASNARLLTNVVPIAAAFRDEVVFQAPRGDAKISDAVVVRFATAPASDASAAAPPAADAPSADAVSSFLAGKSTLGDEDESTFQMEARNLDLWCVLRSHPEKNRVAAVEIDRATLRGGVILSESAFDGSPRMRVAAKEADLVAPGTDEARVVLVGDANNVATFQMRELALSGYNVVVDRAANAFQVVGPGKLAVRPSAETVSAQASRSPQLSQLFTDEPVEIEWAEAMTFDGSVLAFRGSDKNDVLISQRTQTLRCREARFTTSRPISIFALDPKTTDNLDVATIEFLGDFNRPVKIDATTFGPDDANAPDDAFYQAFLQNLRYERAAERFVATGGGTLRATFRSRGDSARLKIPGVPADAPPVADASAADAENWTTVCLKFQNEIVGDLKNREISSSGGVRAVTCQAPRPRFELDVDVPTTQPKDAVRVAGDEARVVLVDGAAPDGQAQNPPQDASFELDLRRNVVFRRDDVFGRCDALKYVAAKNLAILSGDGSTKAALYRQAYSGAPRETLGEFSRALYRLDTNRLEVESISASGVAD
ncbi:MAG: hypothetical protein IJ387_08995 [Thermoguttaceae bacterium]|nr:hypothetical protein [Thermoguttaceae bacterium]